MGVQHFCIGWDVRILHDWWRVNGEGMRAMLAKAASDETEAVAPVPLQTKQSVATY
jgi:4-hydroxy-2-oxoheptanedioate aldolase